MKDEVQERRHLAQEIAKELFDRFVMGGWEPEDAINQIDMWLDSNYAAGERAGIERAARIATNYAGESFYRDGEAISGAIRALATSEEK